MALGKGIEADITCDTDSHSIAKANSHVVLLTYGRHVMFGQSITELQGQ